MPAPEAGVRRATEGDVPALLPLLHRYFLEGDVEHTETEASLLPQVQMPPLGFYVANTPAGLAGCVLGRVLPDMANAAECKRLYVAPEFRGLGLATKLMGAVEDAARTAGCVWMYLDSKDSFAAAMAMYRQRGYAECPRFNDNPQATFFFRKRIG